MLKSQLEQLMKFTVIHIHCTPDQDPLSVKGVAGSGGASQQDPTHIEALRPLE